MSLSPLSYHRREAPFPPPVYSLSFSVALVEGTPLFSCRSVPSSSLRFFFIPYGRPPRMAEGRPFPLGGPRFPFQAFLLFSSRRLLLLFGKIKFRSCPLLSSPGKELYRKDSSLLGEYGFPVRQETFWHSPQNEDGFSLLKGDEGLLLKGDDTLQLLLMRRNGPPLLEEMKDLPTFKGPFSPRLLFSAQWKRTLSRAEILFSSLEGNFSPFPFVSLYSLSECTPFRHEAVSFRVEISLTFRDPL